MTRSRIGGRDFRRVPVKGELTMNNHRRETIRLLIRRSFSGELTKADGEPKTMLFEMASTRSIPGGS